MEMQSVEENGSIKSIKSIKSQQSTRSARSGRSALSDADRLIGALQMPLMG
jgi:hypothetical protein